MVMVNFVDFQEQLISIKTVIFYNFIHTTVQQYIKYMLIEAQFISVSTKKIPTSAQILLIQHES